MFYHSMPEKNKKRPVYLAFFCFVAMFFLPACSQKLSNDDRKALEFSGVTMGTTYAIKIVTSGAVSVDRDGLSQKIEKTLIEFNQVMSTYIDDSELSLFNTSPVGEWFDLSPELGEVIRLSETVYRQSSGAFDITIGPLVNLWGFGPEDTQSLPSETDLDNAKGTVGFQYVELSERKIRKQKNVYLDLSAIAKGHATDVIAQLLEKHHIENYIVEIGGELKIRGRNAKGRVWTIGIENPTFGRTGAVQAISGDNIAIATSGDYRNFYENSGERVSHTIDPVSGRPIQHDLASVTVITESGGLADAYATAINVLGPEKGRALAEREGLAVFLVIRYGKKYRVDYTEQFKQYMVEI